MSTILDSLKKSSDQRDGKDKGSINNFSFANNKKSSRSGIFIIVIILIIVTLAIMYWGYKHLYSENSVSDNSTADNTSISTEGPKAKESEKGSDTVFTTVEKSEENATIPLNLDHKKPKPDSDQVKQELISLQEDNSRQNKNLSDLNKAQVPKTAEQLRVEKQVPTLETLAEVEPKVNTTDSEQKQEVKLEVKKQDIQTQKYLYIYQLPFNIRKDIPKIKLNIHVYDENPDKRIAILNGVRFAINDTIEENVVLIDIIEEGVLLEVSGEKFLIPK